MVAPLLGAVSANPGGAVVSFTNVRVVVVALVALSVATTPSVGALEVAAPQAKLFVVTYGPPTGVVCVHPVVVLPRTGNRTFVARAGLGHGVQELGCRRRAVVVRLC
jgi:hypothetical protein